MRANIQNLQEKKITSSKSRQDVNRHFSKEIYAAKKHEKKLIIAGH